MREIKFDYILKDPVNGELYHCPYTLNQIQDSNKLTDIELEGRIVAKREYTGLKDKNGVEIYEGDIVKEWWLKTAEPEVKAIVYYKNGFYMDDGLHSNWNAEDVEVIGNIYENPELLKENL